VHYGLLLTYILNGYGVAHSNKCTRLGWYNILRSLFIMQYMYLPPWLQAKRYSYPQTRSSISVPRWVTVRGIPSSFASSHPGQLSLLPYMENELCLRLPFGELYSLCRLEQFIRCICVTHVYAESKLFHYNLTSFHELEK